MLLKAVSMLLVTLIAGISYAQTKPLSRSEADQRAKAALALSSGKPKSPTAPAPRPAGLLDRALGRELSKSTQMPLVIYCGFNGPKVSGSVCVRDDKYPGVICPAVVVA